jgi:predicted PurR-regulated permease PerM
MTPEQEQLLISTVEKLDTKVEQLDQNQHLILQRLDRLTIDVEKSNDRIDAYQKASNQVVNLAFTLIGSATVAFVILAVKSFVE